LPVRSLRCADAPVAASITIAEASAAAVVARLDVASILR
jgi:hypothetical protein